MLSSQMSWFSNVQYVNLSEPMWIAGWGIGLIVAAMVARSLNAKSQGRNKATEIPGLAGQRSH